MSSENDLGLADPQPQPESVGVLDEQKLAVMETVQTFVPLKYLRPNFLTQLFEHAVIEELGSGDIILNEGAHDQQHIYLLHGKVELQYDDDSYFVEACHSIEPIAHSQPRDCSIVAAGDCGILRIDSDELDKLLCWSQIADYLLAELSVQRDLDEDIGWIQTVLSSNLFFKVPPVNVEKIFARLHPTLVESGQTIIRQGEIGDCCYFIKEGSAQVIIRDEATQKVKKKVNVFVGRCFGEDALVNEAPRNATVQMLSDGVLMRLDKRDFELLLSEPQVDEILEHDVAQLTENPIYIDCRTEDEYRASHISFSANLPLGLLSLKKRLLAPSKLYLFYCSTGRRSGAAAYLLGKQGYNTLSLEGGLIGNKMDDILVEENDYILREGELVSGQ